MLDWLTVLELTAAALVVLGVLSVIAHFVNQARAKASATESGKKRTVEQPSLVATPEPRNATPPAANVTPPAANVTPPAANVTPPAANATSPAAVVAFPAADAGPLPSESLLPSVEPIPLVREAPLPVVEAIPPERKDATLPVVEANPPASKDAPLPVIKGTPPVSRTDSVRFPRFAKPLAVPAARLKNAVRLKSKIKRRAKPGDAASGLPISFAPVAKAKPALTRRPKRVMQIRPKKMSAPVRRSGKATAHRSSRPGLTPA